MRTLLVLLLAIALHLWPLSVVAQDAQALYEQGVADRKSGKFDDALEKLQAAAELRADDADIQVQVGLTLTALKRLAEARVAFEKALELAPTYLDATLGLARLDYFDKKFQAARENVEKVLKERADDQDARDLLAQIAKATEEEEAQKKVEEAQKKAEETEKKREKAASVNPRTEVASPPVPPAVEPLRWKIDLNGGWSGLTGDRPDWWEGDARLSYQLNPHYTLSGFVTSASRFKIEDTLYEIRVEHKPGPAFNNYIFVAGTPDADFLPEVAVGGGFGLKARDSKGLVNATILTFDARHARYVTGNVEFFNPGVEQYFFNGRLWVTARWINVVDQDNIYSDGYLLRSDIIIAPKWRLYAGYGDAPENVDANIVRTRSVFGGLVYDFNEKITWRASVGYDNRVDLFEQVLVATGITRKF